MRFGTERSNRQEQSSFCMKICIYGQLDGTGFMGKKLYGKVLTGSCWLLKVENINATKYKLNRNVYTWLALRSHYFEVFSKIGFGTSEKQLESA